MNVANIYPELTDLTAIKSLVADDIVQLDQLIIDSLSSEVPLIKIIVKHILSSGGKRLRPLLVLLMSRALDHTASPEVIELAAIIEFVHTATLLHDDVIDKSALRRGNATANTIWGDQAPVLVGDFLYSRAFELLTKRNNARVMQTLAKTTNLIAEGEIMQLSHKQQTISETTYFDIIYRKTAALFASAAECAALIHDAPTPQQQACHAFGKHLGLAFQIMDDMLDYTSSSQTSGKNQGDDIAEGKMTLPLLYAYESASTTERQKIEAALASPSQQATAEIILLVNQPATGERVQQCLQHHGQRALSALHALPDTPFRDALAALVHFGTQRNH